MSRKLCIVYCHNYHREVAAVIAAEGWQDVAAIPVPTGESCVDLTWHDVGSLLPKDCSQVLVLGHNCLKQLGAPPEDWPPVTTHELGNCCDLIAGTSLSKDLTRQKQYLLAPRRLENWQDHLRAKGITPEIAKAYFHEFYRGLVLLDTGVYPEASVRLAEISAALDMPTSRIALGLDHIRLYLVGWVNEWRFNSELSEPQPRDEAQARELADRTLAMSGLALLARAHDEAEAVKAIIELFRQLLSPEEIVFHSFDVSTSDPDARLSPEMQKLLHDESARYVWSSSGNGFALRIAHDGTTLGLLLVDGLNSPPQREYYLRLALTLTDMCGLAIDGARSRQAFRQTDGQLQVALNDLQNFFVTIPDMVCIIDPTGYFQKLNRAWNKTFGFDNDELMSMPFIDFVHPDDREATLLEFEKRLTGETSGVFANRYRCIDGSYRWLEWDATPMVNGQIYAAARDITERKVLEEQLEEITEERAMELAIARDAAEMASKAKSSFLANTSHEIRTPMNAVIGMTELALQASPQPKVRLYLERILASANLLLGVINDILDFSKIESGQFELKPTDFSLAEVLQNVELMVAPRAAEKDLRFSVQIAPDVPRNLVGDSLRLWQVLLNLCNNAVKFTSQGSILVSVRCDPEQETGGGVVLRFSVTDTGIGIAADEEAMLFRPFLQVDSSYTRRTGGTGLGLAICAQIVEIMGGQIFLESQPGIGSEFLFSVPFAISEVEGTKQFNNGDAGDSYRSALAEAVHPGPSQPDKQNMGRRRTPPSIQMPQGYSRASTDAGGLGLLGRKALLVEDDHFNQIVAQENLVRIGMEVAVAKNGKEALEKMQSQNFDVVLMDVQMPIMDGIQATRLIRAMPQFGELPIIAMTAHALLEERHKCLNAGMNDFITKPVSQKILMQTLRKWVKDTAFSAEPSTVQDMTPKPLKSTETSSLPEKLPGISIEVGLEFSNGKPDSYRRMLGVFMNTKADVGRLIRQQLANGDTKLACRTVHSMKSAAGHIGAQELASTAAQLEQVLLAGDLVAAEQLSANLEVMMHEVIEGLHLGLGDIVQLQDQPAKIAAIQ